MFYPFNIMSSSRPAATVLRAISLRADKIILFKLTGGGMAKNFEGYNLTTIAAKMTHDVADFEE
jgi:hypothetical protein